jgi:DNA-binding LacI/PurR family transcriptional regulator
MPLPKPAPRNGPPPRVTIRDVAAHAGLSRATVSLVLNNVAGARIPPQTQERVRAAAAALGFRPNALARALSTSHSRTIGCLSDDITAPQVAPVLAALQKEAWQRQDMLLLAPPIERESDIALHAEALAERRVDAIVICLARPFPVLLPAALAVPVVLIGASPGRAALRATRPAAFCDEKESARQAVSLLLAAGCRRIACLHPTAPDDTILQAIHGYRYALAEAGIDYDPLLEIAGKDETAFRQSLAANKKPDALFCVDETMATAAFAALQGAGIKSGQDMPILIRAQRAPDGPSTPGQVWLVFPAEKLANWAVSRLHPVRPQSSEPAPGDSPILRRIVGEIGLR